MYKAVEEALAGNFKYDPGHLTITPGTLELSLHEGGKLSGSFFYLCERSFFITSW